MLRKTLCAALAITCVACADDLETEDPWPAPAVWAAPLRYVTDTFPNAPSTCEATFSFVREGEDEVGLVQSRHGRMFYGFQASDSDDRNAPLYVFFNGGPGAATSPALLAGGTARKTVLQDEVPLAAPQDNPATWTRFGHLLYLDAVGSGFGTAPELPAGRGVWSDAIDFTLATLRFLECRLDRPDRPVVLVGESWGGARSAYMLWSLRNPTTPETLGGPGIDPTWTTADRTSFAAEVEAHFARVSMGRGDQGTMAHEARVAEQFFAQVLIQPATPSYMITSNATTAWQERFRDVDLGNSSAYWLGRTDEELKGWLAHNVDMVTDPEMGEALLGAQVEEIAWLAPEARVGSVRSANPNAENVIPAEEAEGLVAALGALEPNDRYYVPETWNVSGYGADRSEFFVEQWRHTATFVTDAKLDVLIATPGIPEQLAAAGMVERGRYAEDHLSVELTDGNYAHARVVPFDSGHVVSFGDPDALANAVESWVHDLMTAPRP